MKRKDFLDLVLEEMNKNGAVLTEATALGLLFALPFSAFESTASAIAIAIQYHGEHPWAIEELIVSYTTL